MRHRQRLLPGPEGSELTRIRDWGRIGRLSQAVALVLLCAAVLLGGGAIGRAVNASAAPLPSTGSPSPGALQPISDCIRQYRRAAVLFLVDETGSLHQTDPGNARVAGLQAALLGLDQLTSGEAPAQVAVQMTGFAVQAVQRQPWTPLTSANLPALQAQAQAFTNRNNGFETDYYVALSYARTQLDNQAIQMNPTGTTPVCKMMVWFTDGRLEIDNRTNQYEVNQYGSTVPWAPNIPLTSDQPGINTAATAEARRLICEPGGIADQTRSDGIFSVVVPLETQIQPQDLQFLGAVAQGQSGSTTCGTVGPKTASTGALIPGSDFNQLVLGFYSASVLTPPIPPGATSTGACAPNAGPCPTGTRTFALNAALSSFNVLALTGGATLQVRLYGPNGASVGLDRGSTGPTVVSGATIDWNWLSPTTVLVTGNLPASTSADWSGTWSVTFIDTSGASSAAVNQVAIYLFGSLNAQVVPGTTLRKGTSGSIPIRIVNGAGQPQSSPVIVKDAKVTATIQVPGSPAVPLVLKVTGLGTYVGQYRPAVGIQSGTADIYTEVSVVTPDGYVLPPVGHTSIVPLKNPIGFPSVALGNNGILYLSPIRSLSQQARGSFLLTAGSGATGCSWLTDATTSKSPPGVGKIAYTTSLGNSDARCSAFHPGSHQIIHVVATISGAATGEVAGTLRIVLHSSFDGTNRVETIPLRFSVAVPVTLDTGMAIWLLIAGILGPLLLLYLLNFFARHFQPFDQLRYLTASFQVSGSPQNVTLTRSSPLNMADAAILSRPASLRRFECGGFDFSTHMPASPFGAVTGRVSASGQRVITNVGLSGSGQDSVVPLGLGRLWAVRVSPDDLKAAFAGGTIGASAQADILYLFNSEGAPDVQLGELDDDAQRQLPDLLGALARRLQDRDNGGDRASPAGGVSREDAMASPTELPVLTDGPISSDSGGVSAPLPDLFASAGIPDSSRSDRVQVVDDTPENEPSGTQREPDGSEGASDGVGDLPPLPEL